MLWEKENSKKQEDSSFPKLLSSVSTLNALPSRARKENDVREETKTEEL